MKKSFYEILEVSNSASQEAIEAMYQVLQKRYMSLEGKQYPDAANHLKFLQIAYEVISDPVKRTAYDQRIVTENSTLTEVRQTTKAEKPTLHSQRPAQSEPAAKGADNKALITPVELIAQFKEANRNTTPREDFGERIVAIATKPLVAGIVGLVIVGSMAYSFMKPSRSTATPATKQQAAASNSSKSNIQREMNAPIVEEKKLSVESPSALERESVMASQKPPAPVAEKKSPLISLACQNQTIPGYPLDEITFRESPPEATVNSGSFPATVTNTEILIYFSMGVWKINRISGRFVDPAGSVGYCRSLAKRDF